MAEISIGAATSSLGTGAVIMFHGTDELVKDVETIWTGQPHLSVTARVLSNILNIQPATAELFSSAFSIADTLVGGAAELVAAFGSVPTTLTKAGQALFSEVGSGTIADQLGSVASDAKVSIGDNSASLFGKVPEAGGVVEDIPKP